MKRKKQWLAIGILWAAALLFNLAARSFGGFAEWYASRKLSGLGEYNRKDRLHRCRFPLLNFCSTAESCWFCIGWRGGSSGWQREKETPVRFCFPR